MILKPITTAQGLPQRERSMLSELVSVYNAHQSANTQKLRYYEGKIPLSEVNLGIALPRSVRRLEIGCGWGTKTVDVLASRSMFDGFVSQAGEAVTDVQNIINANGLITAYKKACKDELIFGCTFATLSAGGAAGVKIRFHSPQTAAAIWDGEKGRIRCGMAIIDGRKDSTDTSWRPSIINLYTDEAIWVLTRYQETWIAEEHKHAMGRPLMEPLIYNAVSSKPFGRSRIKEPVRRLIQGYVRTIANATIGLEFATSPQKYLLGITDDQYDALINDKFKQYVGSIIASTTNPETGEKPTFGQLQQGTIEPHVQMLRILATQFSAQTGLSTTDTGIINDANPQSGDAILAQSQSLVSLAEELNSANSDALYTIMLMALAIKRNTTLLDLSDDDKAMMPHFKNPAMPSVSATADAALKIASARQGFANTDVFLEMVGFAQADIRRIRAQESLARGYSMIADIEAEDDDLG